MEELKGGVLGSDGKFYSFPEWQDLVDAGKAVRIGSNRCLNPAALTPRCVFGALGHA